ncbi:DNA cytosine methyltransferase [Pseudomonas sp. HLG18]|uniref:DNA cytosine methyltransferase n=1 Tax=Pseudomonas sp. HLG18 TaxID=3449277 RepID=UPI003F7469CE
MEPEGVRRTSVIEWERCQGLPDNYTRIPWRGSLESACPDGPRYKAIGNSKAVHVIRWIGERIISACHFL